jgi:hypothetical protein
MIKNWLAKRPRYHVHFTPTGGSWLNQVERWFALLTQRVIKRGAHTSISQLERAIREFIDAHNVNPNPSSGLVRLTTSSPASPALPPAPTKSMLPINARFSVTGD